MYTALTKSFVNATDAAEYLVKKGVSFREAYSVVGKAVAYAVDKSKYLHDLSIEEWNAFHVAFNEDIILTLKLENCVDARNIYGGTSRVQVRERLAELKAALF
jgi:argininosuccinate lyase